MKFILFREQGWNGIKNGPLMLLMLENDFKALLTFDKNLQHQQNFQKYSLSVFVLTAGNNTYSTLTVLSPKIHEYLNRNEIPEGPIIIKI